MVARSSLRGDFGGFARSLSLAKSSSVANLDFLRAVAVLFVLIDHTFNHLSNSADEGRNLLSWMGRAGVLFFFVHTCCVLMMSMERHKGEGFFLKFYVRRAFRIYPLSIVGVAIAAACPYRISLTKYETLSNLALVQNLTFAPNSFGSIWTLPLEVQMYLFLPFIFLLITRFKNIWVPVGLFVISIPLAIWQPGHVARARVLAYTPYFLPGVIAYRIFRSDRGKLPAWGFPMILTAISSLFLLYPGWGFPAWAACLALGVTVPIFDQLATPFINKAASTIAKYSYGIYISHSIILMWMRPTWRTLPIYFFAVVASSVLVYHWIEHPMIRLGQKVTAKPKLSTNPTTAPMAS